MSTTIDEKVVEMRFDNKDFEEKTKNTVSLLEKLKSSLKLDGAAKGFDNVNAAAKNVNLNSLSSSVDGLKLKFSAMEVIAVTALSNITTSAMAAGKNLINAFTFEPVMSGFKEYETQINAVQTILANTSAKGTTLEQVNAALDELNHYADLTIYNFTEMTRNIGTFTAAGVDLDTSVKAIQGIANLAAVSGSTSLQASTAMYQLSQALAAGTVKLQDWNSVVNAGMGGEVFQNALKETARDHGIAIDEMEKSEGSFKATLKQRWLSLDILKDTMKKCAGELDSSTTSTNAKLEEFEKIAKEVIRGNWGNGEARKKALAEAGHDYEAIQSVVNHMLLGWEINMDKVNAATIESMNLTDEQKQKLKELAKQAEETGTPLNELIEKMTRPTGRELLIDSLWNTIKAIYNPLKAVKTAWDSLFLINSDQLYNLIDGFHTFTSYLVLNDEQVDKLTRTFKGLFSVLKIFTTFAGGAFGIGLKALRVILRNMDVDILDITARVGDFLYKCSEWINTNNYLTKGLEYFARGVKMLIHLFR